TSSSDGMRQAWTIVEIVWATTVERARGLPEPRLHESVDGEWSFVETLRHLVFATDAWVRRGILGEARAYHRLSMPPDHRVGQPEPGVDVAPWGIDVHAAVSLDEVLDVRADRMATVRRVVDDLGPTGLQRACPPNPAPGFPPTTGLQVGRCLDVVVGEEWAHHGYATRDLAVLEAR
ncbi:MAG TPA: DinB family protein, partial [Nitriliruptorales bacterium]